VESTFVIAADSVADTFTITVGGIYRIKTRAINSIDSSDFSEELIVALARAPAKPQPPKIQLALSDLQSSYLEWEEGYSQDIEVTGYKLYSDNAEPGNQYLIYDGSLNTEVLAFVHQNLVTGAVYTY
jgi:hypothetical protein